MPPLPRPLAALLLCLLFLPLANAETFTAKVVKILDGDTVDVLIADNTTRRIRLAGIDAPEKAQAFGNRAKQQLADLVGGQVVQVESSKIDKYGRTIGKLTVDAEDANLAMISAGLAWWYRQYASEQPAADRASYAAAEAQAKAERRGLWDDPSAIAPWEWRHGGQTRGASTTAPAAPAQPQTPAAVQQQSADAVQGSPTGRTCGAKRFCREMTDCAEAKFYFDQCGQTALDGNHDGIPCNSLCR